MQDAREQLAALGDEKLGGDVLQLKPEGSSLPAAASTGKPAAKAQKAGDAQNYSDEEELAADESAPAASPQVPSGCALMCLCAACLAPPWACEMCSRKFLQAGKPWMGPLVADR